MRTPVHDPAAPIVSKELADQLQRFWYGPVTAKCRLLRRALPKERQQEQLGTWENEGGTPAAPPDDTAAPPDDTTRQPSTRA